MPPSLYVDNVCIITADGKQIRFSQIQSLASAINYYYKLNNGDGLQPALIYATDPDAPSLIAACWQAGIPFYVYPRKASVNVLKIIKTVIKPLFCISFASAKDGYESDITIRKTELEGFDPVDFEPFSDEQIFAYLMTSGTSGTPKVVRLKRKNMIKAALAASENIKPGMQNSWLLILPLNHIGGISVVLRSWIYGNPISDFRFADTQLIMYALQNDTTITMASMVPTQVIKILKENEQFTTHSKFRAILVGGGPSSAEVIEQARKRGVPLMKSYGMTETCAQFTCVTYPELFEIDPKSSGKPLSGNSIEIRNLAGKPCSTDETGLIWIKGEQVIESYLYPAEANTAFDENGWFNTGDFGYLDNGGNLFVEMRRTDLIVSGGENVNPVTVEKALLQLNGIKDAAVVGVNDLKWGQRVVAFIVTDDDFFEPAKWEQALRENLQPFEIPREFRHVTSLPRNELGKLLRAELTPDYT